MGSSISVELFSIGHSTHTVETFVSFLKRYGVAEVADVRSTPYSRFNPQFNRDSLADSLASHGIEYVFLGRELGGRPDDPACYENGRVRYDRVAATPAFQRGLDRVMQDAGARGVAIMCAEKEPLECHRTLLVAQALESRSVSVEHILADGRLEPHAAAMDRLLVMHGDVPQRELFGQHGDRIKRAIAWQVERMGARKKTVRGVTLDK